MLKSKGLGELKLPSKFRKLEFKVSEINKFKINSWQYLMDITNLVNFGKKFAKILKTSL